MGAGTQVEGPVEGGSHGWAFGSAGDDLADGYVEVEYFVHGEAAKYRSTDPTPRPADGRWSVERDGTAPFKTRFLVRRPARADAFNGTVVVCWNNVSAGLDMVGPENSELAEGGFAFVGATVQRIGLEGHPWAPQLGLRGWDSERYGSLTIESDEYSNDICSQIGRLVGPDRPRTPLDPMGGLDVQNVIAYGASQSAQTLGNYINTVQPLDRAYDGFILDVFFGVGLTVSSAGKSEFDDPADFAVTLQAMTAGEAILRTDLGVPIMVVNSESEAPLYYPARQPDTDTFRLWEVAGAAHAGGGAGMPSSLARDLGMGELPIDLGDLGAPSKIDLDPVRAAAFHHMQRWLTDGTPAPAQSRIVFSGEPVDIERDEHGNAVGGIQLPDMQVPTATIKGCAEDGTRSLMGFTGEFPSEKLRLLYPDHETYTAKVEQAVKAGVDAGFLLPRHADAYVRAAGAAPIP